MGYVVVGAVGVCVCACSEAFSHTYSSLFFNLTETPLKTLNGITAFPNGLPEMKTCDTDIL